MKIVVQEEIHADKTAAVSDVEMLTRRQFVARMARQEGLDKRKAKKKWQATFCPD